MKKLIFLVLLPIGVYGQMTKIEKMRSDAIGVKVESINAANKQNMKLFDHYIKLEKSPKTGPVLDFYYGMASLRCLSIQQEHERQLQVLLIEMQDIFITVQRRKIQRLQ